MKTLSRLLLITLLIPGCALSNPAVPLAPGAKFEIYSLTTAGGPSAIEATDPYTDKPVFLRTPPFITALDVQTVSRSNAENGLPAIQVNLTPTGAAKMSTATTNLIGVKVAVVVNDDILSTPQINAPIQNQFIIQGDPDDLKSAYTHLTGTQY